jgi:hypothetical protein
MLKKARILSPGHFSMESFWLDDGRYAVAPG